MDSTALLTAIFGAALGAAVAYSVVKRRWWKAVGSIAIGSASVLNIVTQDNHSHTEHRVVFEATMALIACFAIAAVADARTRRRGSQVTVATAADRVTK
jgi:peptidoglycan/LPS O-acetylase OafA/YrhL